MVLPHRNANDCSGSLICFQFRMDETKFSTLFEVDVNNFNCSRQRVLACLRGAQIEVRPVGERGGAHKTPPHTVASAAASTGPEGVPWEGFQDVQGQRSKN